MKRMKVSEQIRRMMKQSPLTPYRMAKLAGIAPAVLTRFAAGERTLTLDTLDALAPVLGLKVTMNKAAMRKLAAEAPAPGRPPVK